MKNYFLVSNTVTTQPTKEASGFISGFISVCKIRSSYKMKSK